MALHYSILNKPIRKNILTQHSFEYFHIMERPSVEQVANFIDFLSSNDS